MDQRPVVRLLSRFLCLNFLVLLGSFSTWAGEVVEFKSCKVTFDTTGSPVLVKILGSSKKPCVGKVDYDGATIKSGQITMELNDIDTGIPLRNKHLRENYLQVDKFPVATLKLSQANNLASQKAGGVKTNDSFAGTLNLHGKEAPLKDAEYNFSSPKKLIAKFNINLNDHGIEYPSFMGVKVVDVVHVTVTIEL